MPLQTCIVAAQNGATLDGAGFEAAVVTVSVQEEGGAEPAPSLLVLQHDEQRPRALSIVPEDDLQLTGLWERVHEHLEQGRVRLLDSKLEESALLQKRLDRRQRERKDLAGAVAEPGCAGCRRHQPANLHRVVGGHRGQQALLRVPGVVAVAGLPPQRRRALSARS